MNKPCKTKSKTNKSLTRCLELTTRRSHPSRSTTDAHKAAKVRGSERLPYQQIAMLTPHGRRCLRLLGSPVRYGISLKEQKM